MAQTWKKHVVMEQGHCNTAVALDANGDKNLLLGICFFSGVLEDVVEGIGEGEKGG